MWRFILKTIQVTIDDALLDRVDGLSDSIGMARSAFIRRALELALREFRLADLEQRQIAGYQRQPVVADEFDGWEDEQNWGEP
jgi:metal-responsive CopG/Arc/MetJ family transcriptional regulator